MRGTKYFDAIKHLPMLMVVFGAGASYDSNYSLRPSVIGKHEYRPPLANELFDRRFGQFMGDFPECHAVATRLQETGAQVEPVLEEMQSQSELYPQRHNQLAAVRYYLQTMLYHTLARWRTLTYGLSNYKTLLDKIEQRRPSKESVLIVSFNYDTLLEEALPTVGVNITSIDDYVSTHYKIIKLHGSINWARVVTKPNIDAAPQVGRQVVHDVIEHAAELQFTPFYRLTSQYPVERSDSSPWLPQFPALAIPVQTKQGYTCPEAHFSVLRENLPTVTRILSIGWKGSDKTFVESLVKTIQANVSGMIVSRSLDSAKETISGIQTAGLQVKLHPATGGFSEFVLSPESDEFLKQS